MTNNPYPSAYHWDIKNPFSKADYQLKIDLVQDKITDIITKYMNPLEADKVKILDFGCGDGKVIDGIQHVHLGESTQGDITEDIYYELSVEGYEINKDAVRFAKEKLPNNTFHTKLPKQQYEIVTCLDVIEHFPNDIEAREMLKKVTKNYLILTVPTTNLRKSHKHYRHYTLDMIKSLFTNDFEIISYTGYVKIRNWIEKQLYNNNQYLPKSMVKHFIQETNDLKNMGYILVVMKRR